MRKVYLFLVLLCVSVVFTSISEKAIAETFNKKVRAENLEASKKPLPAKANSSLGTHTTGDSEVDGYIVNSCARYDIDPLLIYAQMAQESTFNQKATSYKGARGLMQLTPATAARFGVRNIYDPEQNIEAGVKYMRWLLDKFGGNLSLALAGYNAGEGSIMKYGNQIPPYQETQNYVKRITAHYYEIKNQN